MTGSRRAVDPPNDFPAYRSTELRAPKRPLRPLPGRLSRVTAPLLHGQSIDPGESDLTGRHEGEPLGERITISGRVRDEHGAPLAGALIEVWQANAAGRYAHDVDQHAAPLDPNFSGAGRCITAADGAYRFVTIKPGAYPWRNHPNAWRPAHVHFSVLSAEFAHRLVTQMYFPGDPLLALDPVFNSVADPEARERLVARWSLELTQPEWSLGYEWNIVVSGPDATPPERDRRSMRLPLTPSQTVGPFFAIGLSETIGGDAVPAATPGALRISGQVLDGEGTPVPDAVVETSQPEGAGRCATDDEGHFVIVTVKPAHDRTSAGESGAPHLDISVFARGLLSRLVTRMYFPDERDANTLDPVLAGLTSGERETLVAAPDGGGLRFDIHLEGASETVFFDR